MSSQGIMSGKKANNNPRLCPVKEHTSCLCGETAAWNQFLSLSLSTAKTEPYYQMLVIHTAFYLSFYILPRHLQGQSGPIKFWTELSLVSLLVVSFPHTPACPGTQYSPTMHQVEIFNVFWLCHTNGDVDLAAWRAFRAAWLSQQILTSYSGLAFV
jgi:hypothetical protein